MKSQLANQHTATARQLHADYVPKRALELSGFPSDVHWVRLYLRRKLGLVRTETTYTFKLSTYYTVGVGP